MKKITLFITACVFICSLSFGQKLGKTRVSAGVELGVANSNPLKDIPGNKGYGLGVGVSAQAEHFFKEALSGVASIGLLSYTGRSSGNNQKNKAYTAIPIKVGGNLYAGDKFHVGAQVGVGLNSMGGLSHTTFAYSPQIGYSFSRNDKPLDLTLKYDGYAAENSFSAVGLRLALIL